MAKYMCTVAGDFNAELGWSINMRVSSGADLQTMLTNWAAAWTAAWNDGTHGLKVLYPTTTSITRYRVATLNTAYRETSAAESSVSLAGTATGDSAEYNTSLVVIKRSSIFIGKHTRGRFSLPAPEETFIVANVVTGPATTRVSAAVNAVKTAIGSDGSTFFVVYTGPADLHNPVTPGPEYTTDVFEASNKPGSMRPRTNKQKPDYV